MPVDIRATVTCSLGGELISASVSDSYVQGSGLIQTRGKCEIKGLLRPAIGTSCTFSYSKGSITRTLPRTLRVLSCFPDPFRGITTIVLGCAFTYKQNESEKVIWIGEGEEPPSLDDTMNPDNPSGALPYIGASTIASACLSKLGISGSPPSLTAKFIVEEDQKYDFSSGYVNILSGLLSSESYCGYLDQNETFQWFSLDVEGGSGPSLGTETLIDIGPISGGQQPGGRITVRTRRNTITPSLPDPSEPIGQEPVDPLDPYLPPDPTTSPFPGVDQSGWNRSNTSNTSQALIAYTDPSTGEQQTSTISISQNVEERTTYAVVAGRKVVSSRTIIEEASGAAVAGNIISQYLSAGLAASAAGNGSSTTTETFDYNSRGDEIRHEVIRRGNGLLAAGSVGLPFVIDGEAVPIPSDTFVLERTVTRTVSSNGYRRSVTERYGPWIQTIYGQQAMAESGSAFTSTGAVSSFLAQALSGSYLLDYSVNTGYTSETAQEGPGGSAGGLPPEFYNPGEEEETEIDVDLGGDDEPGDIEFDLPFPTDDYVEERLTEEEKREYYAIEAANAELAVKYGRVQNRLILGNRDGMFFQLAAENMPPQPFSPVFVSAGGLTALYRTNGTNWTMDANGIVASTDGLFWGGAGGASGTGTFWFPVAPGVTELPVTPPVVDTTPDEIIGTEPTLGADPEDTLTTTYPDPTEGDGVFNEETNDFWRFDGSTWVNVGPTPGPTIDVDTVVKPWNETLNVVGSVRCTMRVVGVPYALSAVTEVAPLVRTLATATTVTPEVDPTPQPSDIILLAHMEGNNNSTTFIDSTGLSTLEAAGTAVISTAQAAFGSSSAYFDNTNGCGIKVYPPSALNSESFTLEMWIRYDDIPSYEFSILYAFDASTSIIFDNGTLVFASDDAWISADDLPMTPLEWTHIAVVRDGNTIRLYVYGILSSVTGTTTAAINGSAFHCIGDKNPIDPDNFSGLTFSGFIDEVRLTTGVWYTSSFTPPSAPFADP